MATGKDRTHMSAASCRPPTSRLPPPRGPPLYPLHRLESLAEATAILQFARAEAAKRARFLQHPQLCLDAIQAGVEHGGAVGLQKVRRRGRMGCEDEMCKGIGMEGRM